jgi:hypothetical protein
MCGWGEVGQAALPHIKYAKKMKKFDREVILHPKSRKSIFSVRDSLSTGSTTPVQDIHT